jgi:hypothetical protein
MWLPLPTIALTAATQSPRNFEPIPLPLDIISFICACMHSKKVATILAVCFLLILREFPLDRLANLELSRIQIGGICLLHHHRSPVGGIAHATAHYGRVVNRPAQASGLVGTA